MNAHFKSIRHDQQIHTADGLMTIAQALQKGLTVVINATSGAIFEARDLSTRGFGIVGSQVCDYLDIREVSEVEVYRQPKYDGRFVASSTVVFKDGRRAEFGSYGWGIYREGAAAYLAFRDGRGIHRAQPCAGLIPFAKTPFELLREIASQ